MDKTSLVLGSGEVYFDRFIPGTRQGTGERYVGNTTMFQIKRDVGTVESRRSRGGVAVKDFKDVIAESTMLSITTDNMNLENMADWFSALSTTDAAPSPASFTSETFVVKAGCAFQAGLNAYPMVGVRNMFAPLVTVGGTANTDFIIDSKLGRVYTPSSLTALNGQTATLSYQTRPTTSAVRLSSASTPVRGAIRYIARNSRGKNVNYYFPHVLLTPRDQLDIKGSEWQSITFDAEVLSAWVAYDAGDAGVSAAEEAIFDEGLTLDQFVIVENELDMLTNITIPLRGY